MNNNFWEVMWQIVQAVLVVAVPIVGMIISWALLELVRLKAKVEAIQARLDAEGKALDKRLSGIEGWLQGLGQKLDAIILHQKNGRSSSRET